MSYHWRIYFLDTLFLRNPIECLVAKFLWILYFAVYTTCENIDESLVLGGLNVTSEYAIRVQGVNWDGPGNSSDVLVYYPHVCGEY